jgi:hypothetical protein
MPHNLCQYLAYLATLAVGAAISYGIQWVVMSCLLEPVRTVTKTRAKMQRLQEELTGEAARLEHGPYRELGTRLSGFVGALEIFIYASCVVFGQLEFIGVWFATKYVASFRSWGREPIGRTFYYRSLFGSGLNVLLGFFTGKAAVWMIWFVGRH